MATREEIEAAAEVLLRWIPALHSQASKLAGEALDAAERVREQAARDRRRRDAVERHERETARLDHHGWTHPLIREDRPE